MTLLQFITAVITLRTLNLEKNSHIFKMHPESVGIHSLGHNLFHQHICLFVPNNLSVAVQLTNCHLWDEVTQDPQPFGGILALPPIPKHEKSELLGSQDLLLNARCLRRAEPFSTMGSSGRARLSLTMPGEPRRCRRCSAARGLNKHGPSS